jgi:hypothetical protein
VALPFFLAPAHRTLTPWLILNEGGAAPVEKVLPMIIGGQEQDNWCWAAVSNAISKFYGSKEWSQCKIASAIKGGNCCGSSGSAAPCNEYGKLHEALTLTGNFVRKEMIDQLGSWPVIKFTSLRAEIDNERPVGTRVQWVSNAAHFQAIRGYTVGVSGTPYIHVTDSIYKETTLPFADFGRKYPTQSSTWWNIVYFTQASSGIVLAEKAVQEFTA